MEADASTLDMPSDCCYFVEKAAAAGAAPAFQYFDSIFHHFAVVTQNLGQTRKAVYFQPVFCWFSRDFLRALPALSIRYFLSEHNRITFHSLPLPPKIYIAPSLNCGAAARCWFPWFPVSFPAAWASRAVRCISDRNSFRTLLTSLLVPESGCLAVP